MRIRTWGVLVLWCVSAASAQSPAEAPPVADLLGVWGAERHFPSGLAGDLIVTREGDAWVGDLAGYRASGQSLHGGIYFDFGDSRGEAVVRPAADGARLEGSWRQPAGTINTTRYETPVRLHQTSRDRWEGETAPLVDSFSLYLKFYRGEDGGVRALLRNPERNLGRFVRLGRVERDGEEVRLFDDEDGEVALRGTYGANTDTLAVRFPFQGVSFDFTRRGRDTAPGLHPRPASASPYRYRPPIATTDGWPVGHVEDVGIDRVQIERFVQSILDTPFDGASTPYIQGLLVARRGQLVVDEYFYGFHRKRPHDSRSSSKSLTALLVGIAIEQGADLSLGSGAVDLFPEYADLEHLDERKHGVELRHLLSMSSGFDCDDNNTETPGNEDVMQSQDEQPDWLRYALDLPMVRAPGEGSVYCTAGIHLAGGAMTRALDLPFDRFFARHYAGPLELGRYHWNVTPTGEPYFGGGVHLRPRDHMKMGQLVLDSGLWQGRRIVGADWIEQITGPHASLYGDDDYGLGWWRTTLGDAGVEAYYASGNGGQLVIAVPALELVVAFTGGNYGDFRTWFPFLTELVPNSIFPALGG